MKLYNISQILNEANRKDLVEISVSESDIKFLQTACLHRRTAMAKHPTTSQVHSPTLLMAQSVLSKVCKLLKNGNRILDLSTDEAIALRQVMIEKEEAIADTGKRTHYGHNPSKPILDDYVIGQCRHWAAKIKTAIDQKEADAMAIQKAKDKEKEAKKLQKTLLKSTKK